MTEDAALSADERAELERLRAEVADLRTQVATAPEADEQVVIPPLATAAAAVALSRGHLADRDRMHTRTARWGGRLVKELAHQYRSLRNNRGTAGTRSGDPEPQ